MAKVTRVFSCPNLGPQTREGAPRQFPRETRKRNSPRRKPREAKAAQNHRQSALIPSGRFQARPIRSNASRSTCDAKSPIWRKPIKPNALGCVVLRCVDGFAFCRKATIWLHIRPGPHIKKCGSPHQPPAMRCYVTRCAILSPTRDVPSETGRWSPNVVASFN